LFEVLSLAGGLQPEAGYLVQVTRSLSNGNIPASNVRTDSNAQVSVASIRLKDIINIPNAAENIQFFPATLCPSRGRESCTWSGQFQNLADFPWTKMNHSQRFKSCPWRKACRPRLLPPARGFFAPLPDLQPGLKYPST